MSLRDRFKSMEEQSWVPQQEERQPQQQPQQKEQVELTPGYDGYYDNELPNEHYAEQAYDKSPLAVLDEIKKNPSPRGAYPTLIGGRPVDLHILEDYLLKISPYSLKTILRYHQARTIEELRRYGKGTGGKMNTKILIIIIIIAAMLMLGIAVIFFMPDISGALGGAFGVQTQ
jgi:hypothetical protein